MILEPLHIPPQVCLRCEGHYWTWNTRKYCSKQCQQAASNARYRERHPPVVLAAARCEECEKTFQPFRRGQRWCGQKCVSRAHNRLKKKGPFPGECSQCGESFVSGRYSARFCSVSCQGRAAYLAAVPPRICEECGEPYRRRGRPAPCDDCKAKRLRMEAQARVAAEHLRALKPVRTPYASRLSSRPKARSWVAGTCPCCGEAFVDYALKQPVFCSRECAKRAYRQTRQIRRRAAQGPELIFRRKVFERDGWTCRICRKPVDRDAKVPHPKAATIDHVVPLALGGAHDYTNVQTAHFICNSRKGANVTQLAFAA